MVHHPAIQPEADLPKMTRLHQGRGELTSGDLIAGGLALFGWAGTNLAASQQHLLLALILAALTLAVFLVWGAFLSLDRAV